MTTRTRYAPAMAERHIGGEHGFALRRWQASDVTVIREAFLAADMAWQGVDSVRTDEDAQRWIDQWTHRQVAGVGYALAVLDPDGRVVGNVAVDSVDRRQDSGRVSYWTSPGARDRGVATIGVRALAVWAFDSLELFRLELGHRVDNPASCVVAGRAGFAVEGVQRAKLRRAGVRYDVETHARLRTDHAPPLP